MKGYEVLSTVFPEVITEYFDFVDYRESAERLDYWLDEKKWLEPEDFKKGTLSPYGFTDEKVIQDFPIRGKAVYLHIRRRKWRNKTDGGIITYTYDFSEEGTKLTPEFVAFLKETD